MSPSESDLRAALQHGDDAGLRVNPEAVIAGGRAIRARRVRILSGAAAAVLVASGAVGLAALRGGDNQSSGGANLADVGGGAAQPPQKQHERVPAQAPVPTPAASTVHGQPAGGNYDSAQLCPESAPHLLLPGGGGSGQFGSTDPLFAKPVHTLVVCSYGPPSEAAKATPTRLTFTGRGATQIVASMETAHRSAASTPCEPGPDSTSEVLAFVGITSGGTALPPVTATVSDPACNVQVTNGTAVREGWTPPASLTAALRGLTPPKVPPRTVPGEPTGIEHGSPIHS